MYTKSYTTISASTKGARAISVLSAADGPLSRKALAVECECTVARIGEVVRALGGAVLSTNGLVSIADASLLPTVVEGRSNAVVATDEVTV